MTLDDLKTGMMVKTRDGKYHIIMKDFLDGGDILAGISDSKDISNTWSRISCYNQDMTFPGLPKIDITEVWVGNPFCIDVPEKLIWQRKEYREVTMKEIEEKFGCKVKIVGNEEQHNDGWIPCSEMLPENEDDVLCWYEYRIMQGDHEGEMNRECGIGYYNKSFKRWCGEIYYKQDYKVIAWRPLPEPYKEDEEE